MYRNYTRYCTLQKCISMWPSTRASVTASRLPCHLPATAAPLANSTVPYKWYIPHRRRCSFVACVPLACTWGLSDWSPSLTYTMSPHYLSERAACPRLFRSSSLCPPLSKELYVGTIIHTVPTASTYNTKVRFPNLGIVKRVFFSRARGPYNCFCKE
jgi:hypothetical protein